MELGGKKGNLAAQLKASDERATKAEADLAEAQTKATADAEALKAFEERATKAEADLAEAQTKATVDAEALKASEERATTAEASLAEAQKKLADPAGAYADGAPGRQQALAEGGAPGDASEPQMTWDQARKECGGSYHKAREKHPEVFAREFPEIAKKADAQAKKASE